MDANASAEIIPFPRKRQVQSSTPEGVPDAGRERLMQALASLDAALNAQRRAIAEWRGSLGELRGAMNGLGSSLHRYRDRLGVLGEKVAALNSQARQLERIADGKDLRS